jgi:stage IV sporulation protein FB
MVIAKLAGIKIRMNFIVILLCLLYGYLGLGREILMIFSSVMIHELAHALTARNMGVKITEVELLPFGGQAKIEDFTGLDPDREIYIALSGPVASLSLAGAFYFLITNFYASNPLGQMFITINTLLGLFNLLPALPLDGGRVLRAILSKMMGYKQATRRSAALGKAIAIGIIGYAGYQLYVFHMGLNFLLIGILLFWAANREAKLLAYVFMRYLIHKKSELSQKGILPSKQLVSQQDTLVKTIVESTRPSYYLVTVIVDEQHHIIAMRTEAELIDALFERGPLIRLRDC